MPRTITSPVGRIVQGDVFEPQTTDQQGNLRVFRSGPKMGQPNPQFFIALAIRKDDPAWPAFYAVLDGEARAGFPHLFPGGAACVLPSFAWKVVDGDGVDTTGRSNATKEGFAECWVVRFTSGFAPKVVKFEGGAYRDLAKTEIKRGDYARVSATVSANGRADKPGLYVNLDAVCWEAYGAEIVGGPDAMERFGGAPVALPPGASVTPPASAAPMPTGGAPQNPPGGAASVATPPTYAPAGTPAAGMPTPSNIGTPATTHASPSSAPPPYSGYMTPPPAPPAPVAAPPAPPAPVRRMTAAAQATYEGYVAAGWTDAQLVAAGLMEA